MFTRGPEHEAFHADSPRFYPPSRARLRLCAIAQITELILGRDVLWSYLTRRQLARHRLSCRSLFSRSLRDSSRFEWRVNLVHHPGSLQSKALHILGEGGLQLFDRLPRCRLVAFGDNTRTQFSNPIFSRHQPLPRWSSRANYLNSCGQFETAPVVNCWKSTRGDAVVPNRERLYFSS